MPAPRLLQASDQGGYKRLTPQRLSRPRTYICSSPPLLLLFASLRLCVFCVDSLSLLCLLCCLVVDVLCCARIVRGRRGLGTICMIRRLRIAVLALACVAEMLTHARDVVNTTGPVRAEAVIIACLAVVARIQQSEFHVLRSNVWSNNVRTRGRTHRTHCVHVLLPYSFYSSLLTLYTYRCNNRGTTEPIRV